MDPASILHTISVAAIPIVFAITVHEVAHGWMARRFGDRTAESLGRLSLNPIRHVDPIGTVLVPAILLLLPGHFLFGWAKPVPVDARNMRNPRANMVWVSAAGPAANIAMAIGWSILMSLAQHVALGTASPWIEEMATYGIVFNVMLAVFNMLPVPPLDGGQVLINLLPRGRLSFVLARIAPFGLVAVLILLASGALWPVISLPIYAILALLESAFGIHIR